MLKFITMILIAMIATTVYAVATKEWFLVPLGALAVSAAVLVLIKVSKEVKLSEKNARRKRFKEAGSNWPIKQQKKTRKW